LIVSDGAREGALTLETKNAHAQQKRDGATLTKSPAACNGCWPPGSSKSKAELFDCLHRAFEAPPQVSETPERTRERYIDAIDSVADYLESIGADAVWVDRFDEQSGALEDLGEGEFRRF
jgi:hypothetical protein